MTFSGEMGDRKICRVASIALSLMHMSSNIAQLYIETYGFSERITRREAPFFIFWIMVSLSPIPALLLLRRSCILLGVMAVPIVAIFCGRIYYDWLFLNSGRFIQKGDWAVWSNSLFGLISMVIIAAWICVRLAIILIDFVDSAIRNFKG